MLSRKFTTKEKILLLILALILLAESYYLLVHQRVKKEMEEAQVRTEAATAAYNEESAKAEEKTRMLQKIQEAEQDDSVHPLPDYDNSTNVVAYLNGVMASANEYNLVFNTVTFSDYVAMRSINMSFSCRDYSAARGIVAQLENGAYYCEVTGLSMAAQSGVNDITGGHVFVQMTAVFYEYLEAGTNIEGTEEAQETAG